MPETSESVATKRCEDNEEDLKATKRPKTDEDNSSNGKSDNTHEKDSRGGNEEKTERDTSAGDEPKKPLSRDEGPGILLICGGTNWDVTGKKEPSKSAKNGGASSAQKNLWGPHAWKAQIKVREIASSCNACHSVIITEDGKVMVFGRNDKGQLGTGDTKTKFEPVYVESLKHLKMRSAATGRGHTLFLTEEGDVYSTGDNKMGQLGIGTSGDFLSFPAKVPHAGKPIVRVACGADFSMMVDCDGGLYSFGSPEYGQLGHNSEGKYFITGNRLAFNCETKPRKVVVFIEKTREGHIVPIENVCIKEIACGTNHTLALDNKNRLFTWGFGGYGRLGHNETKDEFMPRILKVFDYNNRGVKKIFAGGAYSMVVDIHGILNFWGQTKVTGDATMYPKPVQDLCNWNVRSAGTSRTSIVVAADESVISWGPSPTYGELGYGESKAKSSTTPQEVKSLDKIYIKKVVCGLGHTLFIAESGPNIKNLPKWP